MEALPFCLCFSLRNKTDCQPGTDELAWRIINLLKLTKILLMVKGNLQVSARNPLRGNISFTRTSNLIIIMHRKLNT